jgi:hypothetical protein
VKVAIHAFNNSANEHLLWDNLRVEAVKSTPFRRGDCNADGIVDLSDVMRGLFWQFLAVPEPPCENACDGNGDGSLGLTDAVYVLQWLYTKGPVPPAPGPFSCGIDSTPSNSPSCGSYTRC